LEPFRIADEKVRIPVSAALENTKPSSSSSASTPYEAPGHRKLLQVLVLTNGRKAVAVVADQRHGVAIRWADLDIAGRGVAHRADFNVGVFEDELKRALD
jgi:hypothetical protein